MEGFRRWWPEAPRGFTASRYRRPLATGRDPVRRSVSSDRALPAPLRRAEAILPTLQVDLVGVDDKTLGMVAKPWLATETGDRVLRCLSGAENAEALGLITSTRLTLVGMPEHEDGRFGLCHVGLPLASRSMSSQRGGRVAVLNAREWSFVANQAKADAAGDDAMRPIDDCRDTRPYGASAPQSGSADSTSPRISVQVVP